MENGDRNLRRYSFIFHERKRFGSIPPQTPQDAILIGPRLLSKRVSSASLKHLFAFIAAGDPHQLGRSTESTMTLGSSVSKPKITQPATPGEKSLDSSSTTPADKSAVKLLGSEFDPEIGSIAGGDDQRKRNSYAAKKTVAQGMMDIALITSNANQLRYLVQYGTVSKTYVFSVSLIVLSLMLQVAVGIILIFKRRSDLEGMSKKDHAQQLNNYVVIGVFMVTIINVFAASFSDFTVNTSSVPIPVPKN